MNISNRNELQTLAKPMEAIGLTASQGHDVRFIASEFPAKKPGSPSAKINLQLDPDMRSDEAAKVILRFLLDVIRINEANIEEDLDIEYLHDFRVAIRRTRSALGQIKAVLPSKTTARFKKDFAFVAGLSNELRDLDVYLLNENTHTSMLPPILRDAIKPLFDHLRQKRSIAFQKFLASLKSKKYARILKDWESFLTAHPRKDRTASNARRPIIDLASTRIYTKYRNVVKTGNQILPQTNDEMLHVLRIQCKKLRYLMEFFVSLFPRQKMNAVIAQMKNMQDQLGKFNDLRIQETYLLNVAKELPADHEQMKNTLLAIGSLIGALDRERQRVKKACSRAFSDFALPANQKRFRKLLVSKPKRIAS
jgi:CHAD domain-containing protein